MLRRVALARTNFSEERIASIIKVKYGWMMIEAMVFSVSSVLTTAAWRIIPEDVIFHNHRRVNLTLTGGAL
jgi:hypothetical protein